MFIIFVRILLHNTGCDGFKVTKSIIHSVRKRDYLNNFFIKLRNIGLYKRNHSFNFPDFIFLPFTGCLFNQFNVQIC